MFFLLVAESGVVLEVEEVEQHGAVGQTGQQQDVVHHSLEESGSSAQVVLFERLALLARHGRDH